MRILVPKTTTKYVSVFVIWLFHISGFIGIAFGNRELFAAFTPINLFISFYLLFSNQIEFSNRNLMSCLAIFLIGMVAEILGVNYGFIFGEYIYLENLGYKIFGVPVLIGVQWILLTFITGSFSSHLFQKNKLKSIISGVLIMILLDLLIEPIAPKLGFWVFSSSVAPFQNYLGWFIIAFFCQIAFQFGINKKEKTFSFHLLIINFLFFGLLNILAL